MLIFIISILIPTLVLTFLTTKILPHLHLPKPLSLTALAISGVIATTFSFFTPYSVFLFLSIFAFLWITYWTTLLSLIKSTHFLKNKKLAPALAALALALILANSYRYLNLVSSFFYIPNINFITQPKTNILTGKCVETRQNYWFYHQGCKTNSQPSSQ